MTVKNKLLALIMLVLLGGACSLEGDIETVLGGLPVPGNNLAEKLEWLRDKAESNKTYLLAVNDNENISPTVLNYDKYFYGFFVTSQNNITIKLQGTGGEKTISPLSNGSLFTIESGVTLVMDTNITLQGRINISNSVIQVRNGGKLIMNGGVISGNGGWGVYVHGGGTLTKNGGTIYGANESDTSLRNRGGAVYVFSPNRIRYNTAGPSVHLDSTKSKAEGGGWD